MKRRRAFVLIELIVAMALLAALAGFGITFIIKFIHLGERQAACAGLTDRAFQLARYVRQDARGARDVRASGGTLDLVRSDGTPVRYVKEDGVLRRIAGKDTQENVGDRVPCNDVRWEVCLDGRLLRGAFVLTAQSPGRVESTFPLVIEACTLPEGSP